MTDGPKFRVLEGGTPPSSPGDGEPFLFAQHGDNVGRWVPIVGDRVTIGRSRSNDVVLLDESVTRVHASIIDRDGQLVIRDEGGTNGTFVNDRRVEEAPLSHGDLVRVGRSIMKFCSGEDSERIYHEEIYRLATTDGLTGVYNRRYFMDVAERELARSRRDALPLALLMLDLDHLQRVNDRSGFTVGDHVLRHVARLTRDRFVPPAVVGRVGGEAFAVMLPGAELDAARSAAEHLRAAIEDVPFAGEARRVAVTVSVGVATLGPEVADLAALVGRAEEHLGEAKRLGRNRVVSD